MAKGGKLALEAASIAEPEINRLGYDLVDTDFIREGQRQILRYYIDKRGGIGINDCEIVSHAVDPLLDEQFSYQQPYYLEVSSPGLGRHLKSAEDYERYAGEIVEFSLYRAKEGRKQFEGKLLGASDDGFSVEIDGETVVFASKDVAKLARKIVF